MVKKIKDPGLGYNSRSDAQSIIRKNGASNIKHINKKFNVNDVYTYFVELSWGTFFLIVFLSYIIMNVLFGYLYTVIGISQITPSKGNFYDDFLSGFFFSAQTLTTVGYGGISPKGVAANFIAAFEAMLGLLSFSFITGLLYGRFSKPKAAIHFSENIILRNLNNKRTLMFRIMNSRKTVMIEPEVTVTLAITKEDETHKFSRNYYRFSLEREKIMYLPTTWTIVHEINEASPLFEYTNEEIGALDAELYILVKYHEESFGQQVYQISSYDFSKLIIGKKYKPSFYYDDEGYTVLDHDRLNEMELM
ncbi:ion channel [Tenacibaculum maritimum]|uniref:ion channel n=1 Tax=Tenacibaculum maritimum TaxID=107401 RepID=UPI0012E5F22D|nr:ion channel [Tenacibaculum maritimum]MCD9582994.1 ion channel [Tenacibaculum maritimum]MCD9636942.1 ion channel [Tenacibaculum maritimum]CAA0206459.1 Ion transport 2 domain protein [Tenacibaculum maritimum]CAA0211307.1 Ion transport 2 domain protein [Tenacibaculum maritimum]